MRWREPAAGADTGKAPNRGLPQGSEPVKLNPADFTIDIDNPYWPMRPGSRWVYSETEPGGTPQKVVVTVTDKVKTIANGVKARVISDVVTEKGKPVEITDDWYAQDKAGNIWYLGEYVTNYENGKVVDHAGSFEAGVDGAQAGVAMPANPVPGLSYRQEYYKGEAEDKASVITVGKEQVGVPFGHFARKVLMTRDLVPTEPKVQELKFYAPAIGPLLSMHTDGPGGRAALRQLHAVVVGAHEVERDVGLVAHDPAVVAGRHVEQVARPHHHLGPVVHQDGRAARHHHADMLHLAARVRPAPDVLRPLPAGLVGRAPDGHARRGSRARSCRARTGGPRRGCRGGGCRACLMSAFSYSDGVLDPDVQVVVVVAARASRRPAGPSSGRFGPDQHRLRPGGHEQVHQPLGEPQVHLPHASSGRRSRPSRRG